MNLSDLLENICFKSSSKKYSIGVSMPEENVTLDDVYRELKDVKKHIKFIEGVIVPEEELSQEELEELDRLRAEALKEHREGKTTPAEEL